MESLFTLTEVMEKLVRTTIEHGDQELIKNLTDEVLYSSAYMVHTESGTHWEKPIVDEAISILEAMEPLELQWENSLTYLYPPHKVKDDAYYRASAHITVVLLGLIVASPQMRLAARERLEQGIAIHEYAARLTTASPLASSNAKNDLLFLLKGGKDNNLDPAAPFLTGSSFIKAAVSVGGARRIIIKSLVERLHY